MNRFMIGKGAALLVVALGGMVSARAEPLHARIDRLLVDGTVAPLAPPASDGEIVRRLYLDFAGRIPTVEEARAYLQSDDPQKHAVLVDQLLGNREYARQMAATFDLWLMERRPGKNVPDDQWRSFLVESFAANKPYHELVREILAADGTEDRNRAAARFYLERSAEPHLVTRDVGRLFFGKDLQCAQCHDHPNVADYLQRDYYGLFAFFMRTSFFQPDTKKPALLAEKADGEAAFQSVFTDVKGAMPPRLPSGGASSDPAVEAGKEYVVAPNPKDKNVRPVPTHSRRLEVARLATDGSNRDFNRNIANRLWGYLMGRCLVDPPDLMHAGNPPSHPELLELLAREFAAMDFDLRAFLRELALTEAYRRSFELPGDLAAQAESLVARIGGLEAEAARLEEAAEAAESIFREARDGWEESMLELEKSRAELEAARKKRGEAVAAKQKVDEPLAKAREALSAAEAKLVVLSEAEAKNAEVTKAFPEDQALRDAAAVIAQRSGQVRGEVETLRGDVVAKQQPVEEAAAVLAAASTAFEEANAKVEAHRTAVNEGEAELDTAHQRFVSERSRARHASGRLEQARRLIAYAAAVQEERVSSEEARRLAAGMAALEQDATAKGALATELTEAHRHASAASAGSPGDSELAGAVELLRNRGAEAAKQAETAAMVLSEHKAQSEAAAARAREAGDTLATLEEEVTEQGSSTFALGVFAPLTPEQLCSSVLHSTGQWEAVHAGVVAEFEKKMAESQAAPAAPEGEQPKEGEQKEAPPKLTEADRERYVEEQMTARLKGSYDRFVRLFGGQAGQPQADFFATADQALFFENDGLVRGWLRPAGENLAGRLAKLEDPNALAEELYLATLTRLPSDEEKGRVASYLSARESDRANALQELTWALLSSVEFRFKH